MSVLEENWNYSIDLDSIVQNANIEYNKKITEWNNSISMKLEKAFRTHKDGKSITNVQDDELRDLVNRNQELRQQIDKELQDISLSQTQYETYKKDQELLSKEIKDIHECYMMAKKVYKKLLNIYHTIELKDCNRQIVFVQFFTESKKESENYSVRLQRNIAMGNITYQIISTTPKLDVLTELQKKLKETNDVPGALCAIRDTFISLKNVKK